MLDGSAMTYVGKLTNDGGSSHGPLR
jgi:hypothetical protein